MFDAKEFQRLLEEEAEERAKSHRLYKEAKEAHELYMIKHKLATDHYATLPPESKAEAYARKYMQDFYAMKNIYGTNR